MMDRLGIAPKNQAVQARAFLIKLSILIGLDGTAPSFPPYLFALLEASGWRA